VPDLKRVIGFWGGTALIVGITIGSGIFLKPPRIANQVANPQAILALWVAFGVISIAGALTLAELSSMIPKTGGVYVYLREAYGDGAAFVFGWIYLLVTTPATIGALGSAFAHFSLQLFDVPIQPWRLPAIGIPAIVVLVLANLFGARLGAGIQRLFTAVKVAALVAIIGGSFLLGRGSLGHVTGGPVEARGFATAVADVIWTYDGWIAVSMIAGEVVAPEKLMKRIIVVGMLVIVALYVGANVAYFYMMPLDVMKGESSGIARTVMTSIAGPWAGTAIVACILCSVFGALNGNVLAKPRVSYAMAQDRLTFGFLGRPHPRWSTPHAAILIQGGMAVLLMLGFSIFSDKPGDLFDYLTTYFVVVEWFALLFSVGAVFILRRRMPDAERPFRTPGYPVVPLLFIVGTTVGLGAIVWGEWTRGNRTPVYGLLIAVAGFPVYSLWRRFAGARLASPPRGE
jgi:APA family basic amino acid/polyamine antiporter